MRKMLGLIVVGMMLLPLVSGAVVFESKGYELYVNPAGNYYVGHATTFWQGIDQPYYGVFLKVSKDGKLEWAYNYSAGRGVVLSNALSLDDGFLLLGEIEGAYNSFPLAMKVDKSGKPVWVRFYNVSLPDVHGGTLVDAVPGKSDFLVLGLLFVWNDE